MHGYTRQEFLGLNTALLMSPDSHALFREQARTVEPGSVFESLGVHIRRDGTPFDVEVHNSMINYRDQPARARHGARCTLKESPKPETL